MNKKPGKTSGQNHPVRKILFSLRLKITLLAISIMIFTVAIISNFILKHQDFIIEQQKQEAIRVSLETFKNSVTKFLYDDRDRVALQNYIGEYTNIDGFHWAMYVDNDGDCLVHSLYTPEYIMNNRSYIVSVGQSTRNVFFENFANELHYEIKRTSETNIFRAKITNLQINVSTNDDGETVSYRYRTNLNILYKRITNGDSVRYEYITNIVLKFTNIDAYMPVYLSDVDSGYRPEVGYLSRQYKLFTEQKLFPYKIAFGRNSYVNRLNPELHNNFSLYFALEKLNERLFDEKNNLTAAAKELIAANVITAGDADYARSKYRLLRSYYMDYWYDYELKDKTVERIISILSNTKTVDAEKIAYFNTMHTKELLFAHGNYIKPYEQSTIGFIFNTAAFLDKYWKDDKETDALKRFFVDRNVIKLDWQTVSESYYKNFLKQTASLYNDLMTPYLAGDRDLFPTDVLNLFKNRMGFYRLGTVRIMLIPGSVEQYKSEMRNDTLDIAIIFILRMLIITFLITSVIFSPLNALNEETDTITLKLNGVKVTGAEDDFNRSMNELKAYLGKDIEIRNRDELGQLADRFNLMIRKFKITFDEIQDKYRMKGELGKAQEIQAAILPKGYPAIDALKFAHVYEPQSESGGDYYDFVEIDDKRFGIVMADVTSHGVGAAMVMAILRSNLRTSAVKHGSYADKVLKDINPLIHRDTPSNMYASVFYGVFNHASRELFYAMAGHEPGLIYNLKDGKIKKMKEGGIPVGTANGVLFDPLVELSKVTLNKGDIFIQYTDGVTEGKNAADELFGEQRFYASIIKNASEDLEAMKKGIMKDLKEFTAGAPQSDDITLLLMLVK